MGVLLPSCPLMHNQLSPVPMLTKMEILPVSLGVEPAGMTSHEMRITKKSVGYECKTRTWVRRWMENLDQMNPRRMIDPSFCTVAMEAEIIH